MNGQEFLWIMFPVDACNVISVLFQVDPFLHTAQFSCPCFQCNCLWNCSSRKTSKQFHQLNAWGSELWFRGEKQWPENILSSITLEKNLCKIPLDELRIWKSFILKVELVRMMSLCFRIRLMNDLMERGILIAFYDERKLFICCLKKASSPAPSANPNTFQCCIIQAFYYYSWHVNVSLSQHQLAAVNTANTNYQEMICLRRKCCKLSSPHNVLKHP